jgi:hypothetical protein
MSDDNYLIKLLEQPPNQINQKLTKKTDNKSSLKLTKSHSVRQKSVVPIRNNLIAKARTIANFNSFIDNEGQYRKSRSFRAVKSDRNKWGSNNMLAPVKEEE